MSQSNNSWWHFYVDGCLCSLCIEYCMKYGIQLTKEQHKKMTYRYQGVPDYYLHVSDRSPQIEEIDDTRDVNSLNVQPTQSNLNNQNSHQIIHHTNSQHVQPLQSNINNQTHNKFECLQQIVSQNQVLITMIQNISNITSFLTNSQNTRQPSVPQNNDTILINSQNTRQPSVPQNNDTILTNTPRPSVSQNNVTTISSQESSSKHQINICDSCMKDNFSNQITESSSKYQINICDSCMKTNFSNQTTSVSVSQINNNQIISNQVNNIPESSTSSQDITATQHILNCTTNVNVNSSSWKPGYFIIIFGLTFLVVGIIFYIIKQLSVVSVYEEIEALFFTIKIDLGQFVKILGPTIIGGIMNLIMKHRN
ncbi:41839_t:CDS:2, partial [Gigaspora margarita]